MADKIFVSGLRTFAKHEKAPDFVLGTLIITLDDLYAWAKANPDHVSMYDGKKQIRLQMTKGDKGVTIAVDTWKKEAASTGPVTAYKPKGDAANFQPDPVEDLPF